MKLKDLDLPHAVYGDMPDSFAECVQRALRRTAKEEMPMKRFTARTIIIALALVAAASIALAAIVSPTVLRFGQWYGDEWENAASQGDIDSTARTFPLGDLVYQIDDIVITGIDNSGEAEDNNEEKMTVHGDECRVILATGIISPKEGANVVLIGSEDHSISDPWNAETHYRSEDTATAEASLSVKDKAAEANAAILCPKVSAKGLLDKSGEPLPAEIGVTQRMQADGTVLFSLEIWLDEPIPRQETYTLSLWVSNWPVDADGTFQMDSRLREEWVIEVTPATAEE